jgi:hypothetical protein
MSVVNVTKRTITGQVDLRKMPPVDRLTPEPIRVAVTAHEDAKKARGEARAALLDLDQFALHPGRASLSRAAKRVAAQRADAQAFADASAAKKKDPGPVNVQAYERDLSAAQRRYESALLVEELRRDELTTALNEYGGDWAYAVYTEEVERRERHTELIAELAENATKATQLHAIGVYLEGGPYKLPQPFVLIARGDGSHEQRPLADVLAQLEDLNGVPRDERSNAQRLRDHFQFVHTTFKHSRD